MAGAARSPDGAGFMAALRADRPAWIIAAAIGLVVLAVLGINGWSKTPDGWVSGGWNWSDLLVHVAIGSSISAGNFPPEVPYFAGVPLTYHWFADFHGAIASTVAGLDIIPVYFASSALFAAVLALVVWALARRLTGDRRVATIATILVVAGGGLGWIRLSATCSRAPATPLAWSAASRTTTPGRTAGRTSRSRRRPVGRNPVPKIDAILKYGQPSTHVLSYERRLTRSMGSPAPASTSPTSRIQPSPPPATTRMVAIVATRRSPVRRLASAQTTSARTAAKSALLAK